MNRSAYGARPRASIGAPSRENSIRSSISMHSGARARERTYRSSRSGWRTLTWPNESTTPSRARIRFAVTSSSSTVANALMAAARYHEWYDQTPQDRARDLRPDRSAQGRLGEAAHVRDGVRGGAGHHQGVPADGARPGVRHLRARDDDLSLLARVRKAVHRHSRLPDAGVPPRRHSLQH